MRLKKTLLISLIIFSSSHFANAQLDNSGFEQRILKDSAIQTPYSFSLRALTFNKNNEYFNKIVKGQTLFGTRIIPSIGWQLDQHINLQGGLFLQKDYGNNNLTYLIPYFSAQYSWNQNQLIMGNINGSIHHKMLEPLEDFERLLYDVPESGIQFLRITDKLFFDVWINWEKMIYQDSPFKEEVSGGLVADYSFIQKEGLTIKGHYQLRAYHKAGQIDALRGVPLITRFNNAIGVSAEKKYNSQHIHGYKMEAYYLHFLDYSHRFTLPFVEGYGYYLNSTLKTKFGDFMLSYWYGDGFYAYKGGEIYQSVSTVPRSRYFEDVRQLLILRVMNDFTIGKHTNILLRFEPYWDFQNNLFEFSHAIYFNIFRTIPIKKLK